MVERGKCYELQAVTSQDDRLQTRIGLPFVRLVEHQRYRLESDRTFWDKSPTGPLPFTLSSMFATVEPKTEENVEHVKVRYCANYIVLRAVSE
jgi:hypothetical protein